ncbi:XdhC family protein [Atlantibacter subterranea]|uniref:XdhC family protein n=2 Tax=Atlantibacter subterraneus TaxID=255519 RepID=A0ABU4E6N3_9ENTR|nr:XdhC family protein [Atlantibacter subterranea]MDV7024778.1 XdhC family protein [Atlantibacter subterranea]MDZ5667971.1 XdhC family protein [Atlantibacter hermannii]
MLQHASLIEPGLLNPEQAFLTDDSREILRFAADALTAGMTAALVTLVEIRGGAARPLGAQMAVRGDGQYCGFVSGGCVESAVAWEALEAMLDGEDRTVVYGEGSPYFDIVLPCGGGITLTVHILRAVQPLLAVLNSLEQRQTTGLRYSPGAQTLTSSQHQPTGWHGEDFVVNYRPCVRVMIPGHSLEAQVTARMAQAAGFDVHICDSFNSKMFDADTAVLLLYHDLHRELPLLQAALAAQPFYIGALGSRRTHEKRVAALVEAGWSQQDIARIKAPIGIFPKARDAHSLALSVLADVAAARHAV